MGFQQGLSGLNATSKSLDVIGNNIANSSTFGAKASRAEFADVYAASLSGATGASPGIGVSVAAVAQQFTQGNITTTQNQMDLAINGRGFFQLQGPAGEKTYTRNGQFRLDRNGFVENAQGYQLLAQQWDEAAGRAAGDAVPIQLQQGLGAAVATGSGTDPALRGVQMTINLDARKTVPTNPIDFDTPDTYNYATSQTLYDSLGAPLAMTYYFRKTDADPSNPNTWEVYGEVEGQPFDGAGGTGLVTTLAFGNDGRLLSGSPAAIDIQDPRSSPLVPPPTPLFSQLQFNFGDTTQYAAGFSIGDLKQDGYTSGELTGIQFDNSGVIKATFSNGRSSNLAQIQLADFQNLQGLEPLGGNMWRESFSSNEPRRDAPGAGSFGRIQAGALEESNVDLTAELVNMITAQRVYQANAQTIKTQDQVLQTLVNLR
jgi:flagellar hook protein FlgE